MSAKIPYSKDGRTLAGAWWNINVTWPWIEDYEPYPLTGKYIDYSTLEGGFANPTLILIDKEGKVAGLYHVYQLGKGEIDGIKSAESLYSDLKSIERGEASGFNGVTSTRSVNYLGMFFLGIVTSLSPCSVALLLAMFSYVMTARRKEEYLKKSASASKEGFMIGVAFTLGMAVVFFVVGLIPLGHWRLHPTGSLLRPGRRAVDDRSWHKHHQAHQRDHRAGFVPPILPKSRSRRFAMRKRRA